MTLTRVYRLCRRCGVRWTAQAGTPVQLRGWCPACRALLADFAATVVVPDGAPPPERGVTVFGRCRVCGSMRVSGLPLERHERVCARRHGRRPPPRVGAGGGT